MRRANKNKHMLLDVDALNSNTMPYKRLRQSSRRRRRLRKKRKQSSRNHLKFIGGHRNDQIDINALNFYPNNANR